ncbi:adhesion G-protein coupled receptor G2-like isoform X2 [Liolophura sinensis]|uniref:adhesion G-protein coupled receptor G2-like isoform X2 n=1 Tax=Liolophura sinensis TaxID=3198878 RepID=UPI0031596B44
MKFVLVVSIVLGNYLLIITGCEIMFLRPSLDHDNRIRLNITERTPANTDIQAFSAQCKGENVRSPLKFYVEGKDEKYFAFHNNVLRNRYLITANPGYNFSVIVVAVETDFTINPQYKDVTTEIMVVNGKPLDLELLAEELHVEIFRGVPPGTVVWSVNRPNLTVAIPTVHTYSDNFEVTRNQLSIVTSRPLSALPPKVKLPISLISNDQTFLPMKTFLTAELQPISEPEVVTAVAVNTSYADVCWKVPAHGVVKKYQLYMESYNISVISDVFPKSDQVEVCAKVHSLVLNQTYTFQVRAVFGRVRSPPSGTYFYTHMLKVETNCPNSTVINVKGVFRWPSTRHGEWRFLNCPTTSGQKTASFVRAKARRKCTITEDMKPRWLDQDASDCPKTELTRDTVTEFIDAIQKSDTNTGESSRLTKMTEVLSETSDIAAEDEKLTEQYIRAVDNLLTAEPDIIQENDTNSKLLQTFENFLGAIDLKNRTNVKLDLPNINVDVREVPYDDTKDGVEYSTSVETHTANDNKQVTTSIKLPQEIFQKLKAPSYRVTFVLYADSKLFPTNKESNYTVERVLLAAVNNQSINNLHDCVKFSLPKPTKNKVDGIHKCGFWNVKEKQWSYTGVTKQGEDDASVHCCSHHLTNFAVMLDVDPNVVIEKVHTNVLSIISFVGSGLSITGLTLTLITYAIFPCLHRNKSGQILLHLGASMLFMHLLFVVGGDEVVLGYRDACTSVAVLIHYTVLSTLIWMGIEAFNLYRLLVRVFAMYEKHFLLKRVVAGWGIPAVFVATALAVDLDNYRQPDSTSCRLSHANVGLYYGTYIGPVCVALTCNLVVFIILLRVLLKPRFDNTLGKRTVTGAQVRGVMSVLVLLGISWIFGAVAIGEAKLVLQYLFVITTSLQGFCIFIFRCLRNFEARAAWRQLWHEGTIKTRRGAIIKTSGPTHTTSTMSGDDKSKSMRCEKHPMSETEESLSKDTKESQFCLDTSKLSRVGSEKGTFWLNKYRLIMGLEKGSITEDKNCNKRM